MAEIHEVREVDEVEVPVERRRSGFGLPFLMFLHSLLTWSSPDLFPAYEIAIAMVICSVTFRYVNPDRPARQVIRTAFTDWRRSKVNGHQVRDPAFTGRHIHIREEIQ